MNELRRTLTFVAVAVVSVATAFGITRWTAPQPLTGFEQVGQPFYPNFNDPTEAKELRVVSFNEETASAKIFNVTFQNGYWRIPSHHDYPADAEDQLAETAASVIGIERGALMSRRSGDHAKYSVIDPLAESSTGLEGRGQRITLTQADGTVLADYIIGEAVEEQENEYYVRRPDEKETYRARVGISLSTNFSDWIEPDLLKLDRDKLADITINKYSIDETQFRIVDREVTELSREKPSDSWELKGLDKDKEELKTDVVQKLVNNLDDLKIVGVRPKPKGLRPDLTIDPQVIRNPLAASVLRNDLQSKGFLVAAHPDQPDSRYLVSNEGELIAHTNEGVVYTLHFGEIFSGTEFEIEAGFIKKDGKESAGEGEAQSAEDNSTDQETDGNEADQDKKNVKRSRYLFVSTEFNPELLGPAPEKPAEPMKPEKPETAKAEKADEGSDPDQDSQPENDTQEKSDDEQAEPKSQAEAEYEAAMAEYEKQMGEYRKQLQDYEDYQEKLKRGKEAAERLNERFAEWYYVISAESFEDLRLSRDSLVKPKKADKPESSNDADSAAEPNQPEQTGPEQTGTDETPDQSPADATQTDATPAAPAPQPQESAPPQPDGASAEDGQKPQPSAAPDAESQDGEPQQEEPAQADDAPSAPEPPQDGVQEEAEPAGDSNASADADAAGDASSDAASSDAASSDGADDSQDSDASQPES